MGTTNQMPVGPGVGVVTGTLTDVAPTLQVGPDPTVQGYMVQCRHDGNYSRYVAEVSADGAVGSWKLVAGIDGYARYINGDSGVLSNAGNYTVASFPSMGGFFRVRATQIDNSSPMIFVLRPVWSLALPNPVTADVPLDVNIKAYRGYDETLFLTRYICPAAAQADVLAGNLYKVYSLWAANLANATRYLKIYYQSSPPTVGGGSATVPDWTFPLPAGFANHLFNLPIHLGAQRSFYAAVTTGFADSDTGAPAAGDVVVNVARNV